MTLQKAQVTEFESHPFFDPLEAEVNSRVRIVEKPRIQEVTYNNVRKNRLFVAIELSKAIEYNDFEDQEEREKNLIRTWSMNPKSQNRAIDLLGDNEEKWVGKELETEKLSLLIKGKLTPVIAVKGAFAETKKKK